MRLGIDYIEGGWPGANPTDDGFFADPPALSRARLTAFGMTRRAGRSAANDPGLAVTLRSRVDTICLVGKADARHAESALGVSLDENLAMIRDSIAEIVRRGKEALFDAEHFFDGYRARPDYALKALETALEAGARWVVLCDTNGGALPHEVEAAVARAGDVVPGSRLGIHAHNDTGNAVANTLAAVRVGARQVQGTLNGLGERCGNADLVTLLPTLTLKMGFETGVPADGLERLTQVSRAFDERPQPPVEPPCPLCRRLGLRAQGGAACLGGGEGPGLLRAHRAGDGWQQAPDPGLRPVGPREHPLALPGDRPRCGPGRSARRAPCRSGEGARVPGLCL